MVQERTSMKRSKIVTLVLSGALLTGCQKKQAVGAGADWTSEDSSEVLTNNTYRNGQYWHAPYHAWYPYPYNFFSPRYGYYHGGRYSQAPDQSGITASRPISTSGNRFASSPSSSRYVSRGGFGSSSHPGS
jgi:hypothetical protein